MTSTPVQEEEQAIVRTYIQSHSDYARAEKALQQAFLPQIHSACEVRQFDRAVAQLVKLPPNSQTAQMAIVAIQLAGHELVPGALLWSEEGRSASQKELCKEFDRTLRLANVATAEATDYFRTVVIEAIEAGDLVEADRRSLRAPAGVPFATARDWARAGWQGWRPSAEDGTSEALGA